MCGHTILTIPVYTAASIIGVEGLALEEPITFGRELMLDDAYELSPGAHRMKLSASGDSFESHLSISTDTETGKPGNGLHLDCWLTMMEPNGSISEVIILVETNKNIVVDVYALPLTDMRPSVPYRLLEVNTDGVQDKFDQVGLCAFARGTHITIAAGEEKRIEHLRVGDLVKTRDHGLQRLRWITQTTYRADAPVCLRTGAAGNDRDLILTPCHRLLPAQYTKQRGSGNYIRMQEVAEQIDDHRIAQLNDANVDYFQLGFDDYQVVYAEGVPADVALKYQHMERVLPEHLPDAAVESGLHSAGQDHPTRAEAKVVQFSDLQSMNVSPTKH